MMLTLVNPIPAACAMECLSAHTLLAGHAAMLAWGSTAQIGNVPLHDDAIAENQRHTFSVVMPPL